MKGIGDRHAEVIASLVTALYAFAQWSLQYLDESAVSPVVDALATGIVSACREQTARTAEENPSARYLDLIRALLRSGRVKLRETKEEKLCGGPRPEVGWRLTENGKTVIYFEKAALHAEVHRFARETNAPTPPAVGLLYPQLVERGFALDDGDKGRNGVRMTLGESRVWFLAFPADVLDGLTEKERQANADAREASRPAVDDPAVEEITRRLANGGDLRIVPSHDPAARREAV